MSKIQVSAEQCRTLFHNLRGDFYQIFTELSGNDEEGWVEAEAELRKAFEMTRYALDVEGLRDSDDLEVFRGTCEDTDGIEPLNQALIDEISEVSSRIADAESQNVTYRQALPDSIAEHFEKHVTSKRQQFDATSTHELPPANLKSIENIKSQAGALHDFGEAVSLLRDSLQDMKHRLEVVNSVI